MINKIDELSRQCSLVGDHFMSFAGEINNLNDMEHIIACSRALEIKFGTIASLLIEKRDELEQNLLPTCPICKEQKENFVVMQCDHYFCFKCIAMNKCRGLGNGEKYYTCPCCRCKWDDINKVLEAPHGASIGELMVFIRDNRHMAMVEAMVNTAQNSH